MSLLARPLQDILAKREQKGSPALLHADLSFEFCVVRDLFGKKVDRVMDRLA